MKQVHAQICRFGLNSDLIQESLLAVVTQNLYGKKLHYYLFPEINEEKWKVGAKTKYDIIRITDITINPTKHPTKVSPCDVISHQNPANTPMTMATDSRNTPKYSTFSLQSSHLIGQS